MHSEVFVFDGKAANFAPRPVSRGEDHSAASLQHVLYYCYTFFIAPLFTIVPSKTGQNRILLSRSSSVAAL